MDSTPQELLKLLTDKTLKGPGFIIKSHEQKQLLEQKLQNYFLELIFDILMQHLSDAQIAELEALPDLESEDAQAKITQMASSVQGFSVILKGKLEKEAEEISLSGQIPEIPQ